MPLPKRSYSPTEWSERHGFSRGFFYKLKREGKGPRTFYAGRLQRVSAEADDDWVREREKETKGDAE